jgi:hypothetical protein
MLDTRTEAEIAYNPEHFDPAPGSSDVSLFKQVNPVGTIAPDFPAVRLRDHATVRLADYLGQGHVVLEFGSVT